MRLTVVRSILVLDCSMGRGAMPGWLTDVLKALGLTTPFIYAAATYGFFHWLDKKASGPAKRAISGWLEPKEYDKAAVAVAIVELFDRVYTKPLFTLRAVRRSASITVVVAAIGMYEFARGSLDETYRFPYDVIAYIGVGVNIITDYLSLFVIRRLLAAKLMPFVAVFLGPFIGALMLLVTNVIFILLVFAILDGLIPEHSQLTTVIVWLPLLIHSWLPFFAICVGLAKGGNYFLLATKQVQWFIKRGRDHPLDALGLVAGPLVFIGAVLVQVLVPK